MINVPLLRKVLEHITEHPEEHDQNSWAEKTACGTTYCMAGHTVVMAGHQIQWSSEPLESNEDAADHIRDSIKLGNANTTYIPWVAAHELGLDNDQATAFFYDATTIEDLWENAEHYTDGEIEIPENMKETI